MVRGLKRAAIRNAKVKSFIKGQQLTASQTLWNLLVEIHANELPEEFFRRNSIRQIVTFLRYEVRNNLYLELYPFISCLNCGISYYEDSKEMLEHKCDDLVTTQFIKSDPVREGVEVYFYYVRCTLSSIPMEKNGCFEVSISGGLYNRTRELYTDLQEANAAYDKLLLMAKNEPIIPLIEAGNNSFYSEELPF